ISLFDIEVHRCVGLSSGSHEFANETYQNFTSWSLHRESRGRDSLLPFPNGPNDPQRLRLEAGPEHEVPSADGKVVIVPRVKDCGKSPHIWVPFHYRLQVDADLDNDLVRFNPDSLSRRGDECDTGGVRKAVEDLHCSAGSSSRWCGPSGSTSSGSHGGASCGWVRPR